MKVILERAIEWWTCTGQPEWETYIHESVLFRRVVDTPSDLVIGTPIELDGERLGVIDIIADFDAKMSVYQVTAFRCGYNFKVDEYDEYKNTLRNLDENTPWDFYNVEKGEAYCDELEEYVTPLTLQEFLDDEAHREVVKLT